MALVQIEFDEWTRAFSKTGKPAYAVKAGKIVEVGDAIEPVKPLIRPALFQEFADLGEDSDIWVRFAGTWGLLETSKFNPAPRSEPLTKWRAEIRSMKRWVSILRDNQPHLGTRMFHNLGLSADIFLTRDPDACSLVLRPRTLLDAMKLQMGQFFAAGRQLSACQECGKPFEVGGERRTDAKYCSDACRIQHNSKRRRKVA